MKFGIKIILGTTIIISVLFACYGTLMIQKNFQVSYDHAINQNIKQHVLYRYSLELSIREIEGYDSKISADTIIKHTEKMLSYGNDPDLIAIVWMEELIFSNEEKIFVDNEVITYYKTKSDSYLVKEVGNNIYMCLASQINVWDNDITIVNAYNLTPIFKERNRQIEYYSKWFLIIILIYAACVIVLCKILTLPIKRLNELSNRIANGNFEERTNIKSNDEIGELSSSFDHMSEAIEEYVHKLEEDVMNREDFVSNFSHELKTPMTSIMGYSKLLLRDNCTEELQKKSAAYIYSECKRLELLSRKLLSLMEIDKTQIDLVSVSTEWMKENIEILVLPMFEEEKVQWSNTWEPCYVKGDGSLLLDMIRNLLENGKNACYETVVLSVRGEKIGNKYKISVKDQGSGIAANEIDKIIQPFYRVDKARSRHHGSSGIGLALCHKIAKVHGQQLEIESKVGQGTTISITLEVEDEENTIL